LVLLIENFRIAIGLRAKIPQVDAARDLFFAFIPTNLLQNYLRATDCVRARLQSCRKSNKIMLGFSLCGFCFQLFAIAQRLKPESKLAIYGTTEVVP
jgi:hypothetical protein